MKKPGTPPADPLQMHVRLAASEGCARVSEVALLADREEARRIHSAVLQIGTKLALRYGFGVPREVATGDDLKEERKL